MFKYLLQYVTTVKQTLAFGIVYRLLSVEWGYFRGRIFKWPHLKFRKRKLWPHKLKCDFFLTLEINNVQIIFLNLHFKFKHFENDNYVSFQRSPSHEF
jgi:hypothetical protein